MLSGVWVLLGCVLSITGSDIITPPVDRQTGVKTLPCPKLRLRAVTRRHFSRMPTLRLPTDVYIGVSTWGARSRSNFFHFHTVLGKTFAK